MKKIVASITMCCVMAENSVAKDLLETTGDLLLVAIPAAAYATTFRIDDQEGREQFHYAFLTNAGITYGLKYAIDKKRPNGEDHSFPSGHTSATFQGAAFLHKRYGFAYAWPAYAGAVITGYSRVQTDHHYVEDVLAGAVIGTLSSFLLTTTYKGVDIRPVISDDSYGMQFMTRW